jgi:hypothetical protein
MPLDSIFGNASYYGGFVWAYGIQKDMWDAAADSYRKNLGALSKPTLITLIDYRVRSDEPRLWTLDFVGPFPIVVTRTLVSHGKGSGTGPIVTSVSRESGSNKSCVGGFVTRHIYQSTLGQKDKSKSRPAMVLDGLDASNSNARLRGIRMHGAHYVSDTRAGTSLGCICCKQDIHEELIKLICNGSFMFAYFGPDHVRL